MHNNRYAKQSIRALLENSLELRAREREVKSVERQKLGNRVIFKKLHISSEWKFKARSYLKKLHR